MSLATPTAQVRLNNAMPIHAKSAALFRVINELYAAAYQSFCQTRTMGYRPVSEASYLERWNHH
jgi:hypothetical protein